ncbi:hypothetical protein Ahy_B10g105204 [Arachis hypogaea]|uniref:Uncharacterized protein n=1 Tax=Arachis hypogaea TaxID=3818 RepID=A0A444X7W5_ARAHY|nr:hypothetical protein Ahy_B10g105204 [Arachis hypogaea]
MQEITASSSTVCKICSLRSTVRFCVVVEWTTWLPIHPPLIVVEEEEEDFYFDAMEEEEEDFFDEMDENSHVDGGVADDDALDEYEMLTKVTDTSAAQARKGKDIQGIQWDRLNISRDSYRVTRLEQYKNYENIPASGDAVNEDCKRSVKGEKYYDFFYNTRMYLFGSLVLYSCISSYVLSTAFFVSPPAPIQHRRDHLLLLLTTLHCDSLARPCLSHFQSQNQNRATPVPPSSDVAAVGHCHCIPLSYALALFFDSVFNNMLSGVWCDVDVVEFSYYGAPAPTPKEQLYTELADGLREAIPVLALVAIQ